MGVALVVFQGIDVFGKGAVERDHADQVGVRVNQLPRRLVAVQTNKLVEQRLRKQHRVTISALIRSQRDLAVALSPLVSHAIYRFRIDSWLVTEKNHDRVRSWIERPDAHAVRRGAAVAEDRIFNHLRVAEGNFHADLISRAAQNDDHLVKPFSPFGLIDDPAEQSGSSEGQKLFGLSVTALSAPPKNQSRDELPHIESMSRISTASGSERGSINRSLMEPRSLPLAVLIMLWRLLECLFASKAAEIKNVLLEDRFISRVR